MDNQVAAVRFFSDKKTIVVPVSKIKKFVIKEDYSHLKDVPFNVWRYNDVLEEDELEPAQILEVAS